MFTKARAPALGNEAGQVLGTDPDYVDDANVRQRAIGGPLVDGCDTHAEQLSDLADGEELLDRR